MPSHLDGKDTGSSPASEAETLDVVDQVNPESQDTVPDSSSGADGKEAVSEADWDPLSIVKKAVEPENKEADEGDDGDHSKQPDASSQSEKDGQGAEAAEGELGEITDEELKSYKPKTRKRIEGLLDDRQRLTERLETLEPAAQQMETLQQFMQESRLTPQNVSELLVVGRLAMSGDPKDLQSALVRAKQFTAQIEAAIGETIPEDLQRKLDEGLIDEGTAREVARERATARLAQANAQRANETVETTQQQSRQQTAQAAAQVVNSTVSDWERQKISSDPDYPQKAELLQKEIRLRVAAAGGSVLNPTQALKIADEAYAEVNRIFKSLVPQKAPEAKRMMQSKAIPGTMASTPNSPLEAARAGIAKAHGG